ncbi:hypothetical protein, partial [Myroides indicus]|uniref:hypothetical protein n=1 Tax=Myroides indicus TaxID=1323422 RepID=UPI00141528EB
APKTSAYLDVEAEDKGILIPRVSLRSLSEFAPITGDKEESLLVYNTASAGTGDLAVSPGFYFWRTDKGGYWERLTNVTDLKQVIDGMDERVDDVLALLKVAYPSNNLEGTPTGGSELGGGMVFIPGTDNDSAKIEYVYYDSATSTYVKKDITAELESLISASESKTTIVTYGGNQYYLSEAYIQNGGVTDASQWTSVPTGAILIDVVGGVVNNFNELVTNNPVTIGGNTYNTVQEYIEYISKNATQDGALKIVLDAANPGNAKFQQWNGTNETWGDIAALEFKSIVTHNETRTFIGRSVDGAGYTELITDVKGDNKIVYEFTPERGEQNYIDVTADILYSLTNNEDIYNQVKNIINQGGNVYYGDVNGTNVFYTMVGDVKTPIDISQTIVNAITNIDDSQTNIIKNKLGDTIDASSNTSVFTGDTYVENGVTYYIYRGEFTTTVQGRTARTSGVTLDKDGHKILSIGLNYGVGSTASVTDVVVSGKSLGLKLGVGKQYHVISDTDVEAKVMVEFASSDKPAGV